ncbi:MAG: hypothetical protein WC055_00200 [Melioribacteraceae bacterium]
MGKCDKQTVLAVIVNKDKIFYGTNNCLTPQEVCPRQNMESGTGYELCKDICQQTNHAEVNACVNAGEFAKGLTLYLFGHTYCCDNCKKVMDKYGIKEVVFMS